MTEIKSGKILRVLNMGDKLAAKSTRPMFVNDFPMDTEADRQYLQDLLVTNYNTTDVFVNVPRCECGVLDKGYYVNAKGEGKICPVCGTEAVAPTARKIESTLYIRAPEGIKKLITPLGWIILSIPVKPSRFNLISYITNPSYRELENSNRAMLLVDKFKALGIPRGLNSFYDNFELICDMIYNLYKSDEADDWLEFTRRFKDKIFTDVLPIPSKVAFAVEHTSLGTFYDKTMSTCTEAVYSAATMNALGNYETSSRMAQRQINTRISTILSGLADFFEMTWKANISPKQGWLRQAVYGCRMNFSFRDIITSRHEPHDYRKIGVTYKTILNCYQAMVYGKLFRRGYNHSEATNLIKSNMIHRHPLLLEILEELIDETPEDTPSFAMEGHERFANHLTTRKRKGRGLPITITRPPSLDRLSTMFLYIDKITEESTEISLLDVIGCNADFD